MAGLISRGFARRRRGPEVDPARLPPGQYAELGFPVLTAGPTPRIGPDDWVIGIDGEVTDEVRWTAAEFRELPFETIPCDIHCVTKWSKLGTSFGGVSLDVFLDAAGPQAPYATVFSYTGYTTNLALDDLTGGKAWVVTHHEGEPLEPEHGGPVRLLVPHLYFWKSAKWLAGLRITAEDEPGFWEVNGYHNRGDPWREQRYRSDP